jgi:hypothetical protein
MRFYKFLIILSIGLSLIILNTCKKDKSTYDVSCTVMPLGDKVGYIIKCFGNTYDASNGFGHYFSISCVDANVIVKKGVTVTLSGYALPEIDSTALITISIVKDGTVMAQKTTHKKDSIFYKF